MHKLAIFDLDGTLLNTIDDLAVACNHALRTNGFAEHPHDAYKLFVGNGVHNLVLRALPEDERNTAATEQVEAVFNEYYSAHAQDHTRPYDGIPEALRAIRDAGVKIAVLSNKPDAYTGVLVKQYFPGLVDVAYGQREGVPIKPDPAAVYEIMNLLGFDARETVYIGDSGVDMQTGSNAGVKAIGVLWGFRTRNELETYGAAVLVDKPFDLVKNIVDNS